MNVHGGVHECAASVLIGTFGRQRLEAELRGDSMFATPTSNAATAAPGFPSRDSVASTTAPLSAVNSQAVVTRNSSSASGMRASQRGRGGIFSGSAVNSESLNADDLMGFDETEADMDSTALPAIAEGGGGGGGVGVSARSRLSPSSDAVMSPSDVGGGGGGGSDDDGLLVVSPPREGDWTTSDDRVEGLVRDVASLRAAVLALRHETTRQVNAVAADNRVVVELLRSLLAAPKPQKVSNDGFEL